MIFFIEQMITKNEGVSAIFVTTVFFLLMRYLESYKISESCLHGRYILYTYMYYMNPYIARTITTCVTNISKKYTK